MDNQTLLGLFLLKNNLKEMDIKKIEDFNLKDCVENAFLEILDEYDYSYNIYNDVLEIYLEDKIQKMIPNYYKYFEFKSVKSRINNLNRVVDIIERCIDRVLVDFPDLQPIINIEEDRDRNNVISITFQNVDKLKFV